MSQEYQRRNETNEILHSTRRTPGRPSHRIQERHQAFGDRLLIEDLSLQIPPGAIVGIIGPNGAGKSTLFRMITGREKPDKGEVNVGHTVKIAYVDQSRDSLQADKNVWQEVSGGSDIITIGKYRNPVARLRRPLQLQGLGPAEAGRHALGR